MAPQILERQITVTMYSVIENDRILMRTASKIKATALSDCIQICGLSELQNIFSPNQGAIENMTREKPKEMANQILYSKEQIEFITKQISIVRDHANRNKYYGYYHQYWQKISNMTDGQIHGLIANCRSLDKKNIMQLIWLRIKRGQLDGE